MDLRVFCLTTFGEEESFVDRNPKERDHLEDLDIERRTTLECILKALIGRAWAGLI
jgi:hypothetical protein